MEKVSFHLLSGLGFSSIYFYHLDFKHELLGLPLRRLLKDDAIPTLFDYNKDKQPAKRKCSESREKVKTKQKLCEDAIQHHELVQSFELECNTKETQTETPTPKMVDVGIQCKIDLGASLPPISLSENSDLEDSGDKTGKIDDNDFQEEIESD